ncbi:glycosyltransferase [Isoptericola sp. 4D.3]|uniref:Glycosyltransferase n=1 Tax=Isoptericola peretonis TaxID=2918523 RepID=A0ABT0J4S6_9MICO|nr:glycosyltransferase [Isoptericola sp. 4D.3]
MPHTYLFALTDGGGTVPPELGAARRLVERGHRVTVLVEDSMAPEARVTGATVVPWEHGPNRPDRDPAHDPLRDWEATSPLAQARRMGDTAIAGPAPGHARDVLEAIERDRPDLVVASIFAFGAMMAAESCGIAFDVLLPNIYSPPTPGVTPMGMGLRPARGPAGRTRDALLRRLSVAGFDRYTLGRLNALRAEFGLEPLAHSWDQVHRARRQLVMTSPAFDLPARLPANARYVGPLLDDPTWADDPAWASPTGDAPLVLVAMSSTFQDHVGVLQRIVDGLATLPVRGIVTSGPAVAPEEVRAAPNVTVVGSAPHGSLMRDAAAVVTHGGHGTLLKALAAGCPVVVLPHGRDQADNAVRVTLRGAGRALPRKASAERVADAVRRVLDDPSYADAATALGAAVRQDAEGSTLLAELEDLVPARSGAAGSGA